MKAKALGWRNFLIATSMRVFPAHVLATFDGAGYLRDYNFKLMPGTGPYTVNEADIKKGASISLRRRADTAENNARASMQNFDEIRSVVGWDQNSHSRYSNAGSRLLPVNICSRLRS
jgi:hypothetical protein